MAELDFKPRGVCSKNIHIDVEDGIIQEVTFTGGCDGNLKAISKLVQGKTVDEIAELLEGNTCGPRFTSCADQMVQGLKQAL
ncbi:MAG: TIGR03905 family TSCPD domain-containing protein [Eggerthellaceae bacterium]|nr:TIGR03905 family TSCPD domain-containing protein [Eggerthellaceae bacterium]